MKENLKRKVLSLCGLLLVAAAPAVQAQFTYTTNDGSITITGFTGPGGAVTIPDEINNLPVTGIGDYAFNFGSLTGVTIPSSVTSIGDYAFNSCLSLSKVTMSNGVTSIGDYAFDGDAMTSVTIPNSVTNIGQYAFDSTGLTSITIPSSVTSIGQGAFQDCFHLPAIKVDTNNPAYTSDSGVLLNKSQTVLLVFPQDKAAASYQISNTVTSIAGYAFYNCSSLTTVTIPSGVTNIGQHAFDSAGLTSITIPSSVTSIGQGAFQDCFYLPAIKVDTNNPAYTSDSGVLLNKSQTVLLVFPQDKAAASYQISNTVTSIADYAFYNCSSLTTVTIPSGVTNIGQDAFENCFDLSKVLFQGNAPSGDDSSVFLGDNSATAYYLAGTSGWGSIFDGRPAVMLNPPTPAGLLQVTITPVGAIAAGAQWQVDGGIAQSSGATVLGLSVGNHTVSFSFINGWTTPASQTVTVLSNMTTTASANYVALLGGIQLSGTNLVLSGVNGLPGATCYVLMGTNLALSLSQWTPIATNVLSASGSVTIILTNGAAAGGEQAFYILRQ